MSVLSNKHNRNVHRVLCDKHSSAKPGISEKKIVEKLREQLEWQGETENEKIRLNNYFSSY
jgi:hypothetical protein